jgi:hypothetical protein
VIRFHSEEETKQIQLTQKIYYTKQYAQYLNVSVGDILKEEPETKVYKDENEEREANFERIMKKKRLLTDQGALIVPPPSKIQKVEPNTTIELNEYELEAITPHILPTDTKESAIDVERESIPKIEQPIQQTQPSISQNYSTQQALTSSNEKQQPEEEEDDLLKSLFAPPEPLQQSEQSLDKRLFG